MLSTDSEYQMFLRDTKKLRYPKSSSIWKSWLVSTTKAIGCENASQTIRISNQTLLKTLLICPSKGASFCHTVLWWHRCDTITNMLLLQRFQNLEEMSHLKIYLQEVSWKSTSLIFHNESIYTLNTQWSFYFRKFFFIKNQVGFTIQWSLIFTAHQVSFQPG